MISFVLLLCLLLIATVTDVTQHKVYNWLTYPGIVAGIALNSFGFGVITIGSVLERLLQSLAGFGACGFIMLVCFVFFNMGGGDVKLIAMIGAFLGLENGIQAILWTFVLGAILGLVLLIWQIGFLRIVSKCVQHLVIIARARSWVPLTDKERAPLKRGLFLAPSGFAAVCVVAKDCLLNSM